jgi:hypothetical protein
LADRELTGQLLTDCHRSMPDALRAVDPDGVVIEEAREFDGVGVVYWPPGEQGCVMS